MDKNKDIKEISVADDKIVQELNVQQESIMKDADTYLKIEQKLREESQDKNPKSTEDISSTAAADNVVNNINKSEKTMDQNETNKDANVKTETDTLQSNKDTQSKSYDVHPQGAAIAPITYATKSNWVLGLSTAILAIAISAISVYGYQELNTLKQEKINYTNATYELNKSNTLLEKSIEENKLLQAKLDTLTNENLALRQDNQNLVAQYEQNNKLLEQNNLDVAKLNSRIDKYESRDPNDWIIAKAYYLINSAYHDTINSSDLQGAIFELKSAQNLIAHIKSKNIVDLRAALSADINTLENLKPIDITGITIKINDLYHNVELLTFIQPEELFDETNNTADDKANASWYTNALNSLATFSKRFVEIKKRSDNSIDEFLSPKEGAIIKENIKLTLNMIKANLTNHNNEAYKDNLDLVLSLLDLYFDKNNTVFTNMEKDLLELRDLDISYNIQSQLKSYEKINTIISKQIKDLNLGAKND